MLSPQDAKRVNDSDCLREKTVCFLVIFFVLIIPLRASAVDDVETAALTVTSPSYPDHNAWYNSRNASFEWNLSDSVTAIRTLYGNDPLSTPNKVYTPPVSGKEFLVSEDGIMYMHVQAKTVSGWGPISHYKFQIDTKPPTDIVTTLLDGVETYRTNPDIKVTADDNLSGLAQVDLVLDGTATTTFSASTNGVYTLYDVKPGKHTVDVYVRDHAGNVGTDRASFTAIELNAPEITQYQKYATVGDVLKVVGSTYPNVPVEITYTNTKNDNTYTKTVQSDSDGTFRSLWTDDIPAGVYEMRARVVDGNGATGAYSTPRVLSLEQQPYIRLGMFVMNWLSLILILILSGFSMAAVSWYGWLHFQRFRHGVHRKFKEVEGSLKTNAVALRRDSEEFYTLLTRTEKKRELTKEEKAVMRKSKKRLDAIEQEIESKLKELGQDKV